MKKLQITASLFKDERSTFERIEKFISKHHFVDCNLRGRLYEEKTSVQISLLHADFGSERVSFEIVKDRFDTDKGLINRITHFI
jgi:hypothetical protein